MKKYFLMLFIVITFFFANQVTAKTPIKKPTIKRFVFAIGANNGGSDRVKLQYAQSDAKSIVRVLQKMGGVVPEDCFLLNQPDPERLRKEMTNLNNRVKRAKIEHSRVEVIFYYSGHSDKESLFLKNEKITYNEYRELINEINSNVKITILDSCASGTFTRFKGVKPRPPFLLDNANNMEGFAIITSCSSEEASQESDYLKGSFFTHNFVAGLRGAADVIQDGKVTLNEAYQFAFNQTLVNTDKTMGGQQHPHYNIQMSGTGDVVMTDIRESSGVIVFDNNIFGKLMVWDEQDLLVIEIKKIRGKILKLGLDKGKYRLVNIFSGKIYESNIIIKKDKTIFAVHDNFKKSDLVKTRSRGTEIAVFDIVKKQSKFSPFIALKTQSRNIIGESGVSPVFTLGITQQSGLSIGLFGLIGSEKWFGGLAFKYAFFRKKPLQFEVGMNLSLFGANLKEYFSSLESEFQLVWKLKNNIRLGAGLSIPLAMASDSSYADMPSLFISLRFGK